MLKQAILAATLAIAAAVPTAARSADPVQTPSEPSPHILHMMATRVATAGGRLVSVGERGVILLSDDQGRTWRQVATPVRVTLTAVHFPTPKAGWAVGHGGVILVSRDGGESWSRELDGIAAAAVEQRQAVAGLAADPENDGAKRRAGEAERLVQDGPDKPLLDVLFFDETHGLAVGAYGLAFRTDDGGRSWLSLMGRTDNTGGRHLYSIHAAPSGLYIAGEQGLLLKSTDGGQSFQNIETGSRATFFGMTSTADGVLIAFGLRGTLTRSEDGGARWSRIGMPPVSLVAGRRLQDGSLILVDETGRLLRSTDAGRSFAPLALSALSGPAGVMEAVPGLLILSGAQGNARIGMTVPSPEGSK